MSDTETRQAPTDPQPPQQTSPEFNDRIISDNAIAIINIVHTHPGITSEEITRLHGQGLSNISIGRTLSSRITREYLEKKGLRIKTGKITTEGQHHTHYSIEKILTGEETAKIQAEIKKRVALALQDPTLIPEEREILVKLSINKPLRASEIDPENPQGIATRIRRRTSKFLRHGLAITKVALSVHPSGSKTTTAYELTLANTETPPPKKPESAPSSTKKAILESATSGKRTITKEILDIIFSSTNERIAREQIASLAEKFGNKSPVPTIIGNVNLALARRKIPCKLVKKDGGYVAKYEKPPTPAPQESLTQPKLSIIERIRSLNLPETTTTILEILAEQKAKNGPPLTTRELANHPRITGENPDSIWRKFHSPKVKEALATVGLKIEIERITLRTGSETGRKTEQKNAFRLTEIDSAQPALTQEEQETILTFATTLPTIHAQVTEILVTANRPLTANEIGEKMSPKKDARGAGTVAQRIQTHLQKIGFDVHIKTEKQYSQRTNTYQIVRAPSSQEPATSETTATPEITPEKSFTQIINEALASGAIHISEDSPEIVPILQTLARISDEAPEKHIDTKEIAKELKLNPRAVSGIFHILNNSLLFAGLRIETNKSRKKGGHLRKLYRLSRLPAEEIPKTPQKLLQKIADTKEPGLRKAFLTEIANAPNGLPVKRAKELRKQYNSKVSIHTTKIIVNDYDTLKNTPIYIAYDQKTKIFTVSFRKIRTSEATPAPATSETSATPPTAPESLPETGSFTEIITQALAQNQIRLTGPLSESKKQILLILAKASDAGTPLTSIEISKKLPPDTKLNNLGVSNVIQSLEKTILHLGIEIKEDESNIGINRLRGTTYLLVKSEKTPTDEEMIKKMTEKIRSPLNKEILLFLASHPEGLSKEQVSEIAEKHESITPPQGIIGNINTILANTPYRIEKRNEKYVITKHIAEPTLQETPPPPSPQPATPEPISEIATPTDTTTPEEPTAPEAIPETGSFTQIINETQEKLLENEKQILLILAKASDKGEAITVAQILERIQGGSTLRKTGSALSAKLMKLKKFLLSLGIETEEKEIKNHVGKLIKTYRLIRLKKLTDEDTVRKFMETIRSPMVKEILLRALSPEGISQNEVEKIASRHGRKTKTRGTISNINRITLKRTPYEIKGRMIKRGTGQRYSIMKREGNEYIPITRTNKEEITQAAPASTPTSATTEQSQPAESPEALALEEALTQIKELTAQLTTTQGQLAQNQTELAQAQTELAEERARPAPEPAPQPTPPSTPPAEPPEKPSRKRTAREQALLKRATEAEQSQHALLQRARNAEAAVRILERTRADLEQQRVAVSEELASIRKLLTRKIDQLEALQETSTPSENSGTLAQKDAAIARLTAKLEEAKARQRETQSDLDRLRQASAGAIRTATQTRVMEQLATKAEANPTDLYPQLQLALAEKDRATTEIAQLTAEIARLTEQLRLSQAQVLELEQDDPSVAGIFKRISTAFQQLTASNATLISSLATAESKAATDKQLLAAAQARVLAAETRAGSATTQLAQAQAQLSQAKAEISALKKALAETAPRAPEATQAPAPVEPTQAQAQLQARLAQAQADLTEAREASAQQIATITQTARLQIEAAYSALKEPARTLRQPRTIPDYQPLADLLYNTNAKQNPETFERTLRKTLLRILDIETATPKTIRGKLTTAALMETDITIRQILETYITEITPPRQGRLKRLPRVYSRIHVKEIIKQMNRPRQQGTPEIS
ncbi:MAG: hypothetical protein WC651_01220 [Candidatus Gracilibacteria bacterium]|jgi:hypothetical protein